MSKPLFNLQKAKKPGIFGLLRPYIKPIGVLVMLAVASSSAGLILPKIISHAIDSYIHKTYDASLLLWEFGGTIAAIFVITYVQNIVQTYTSEMFVAQAIASLASSVIIIIGAAILLFSINWKLAIAVITIIPILGTLFFFVFSKVKVLMKRSREVVDWLNKVINESILGSALIRVLNSQQSEYEKFVTANTDAKDNGIRILKTFASMIPIITFVANIAMLVILVMGGHFIIGGTMTLGDFTAFNSYVALLIFPILLIGMMSNVMAQATASYQRIAEVLHTKEEEKVGTLKKSLKGNVELKDITLTFGEKPALKNVSLKISGKSKTAIIGPTAAGKTQLLYLLIGLTHATAGTVKYDGEDIGSYDKETLHSQVGFVFQDSIIFNLTLRENIAFSDTVKDIDLQKAIETAELEDFIGTLPNGLDTIVSERGSSLSGGQKQRIMLARALALNPKILLLDDFTARVDNKTERKILDNIEKNYPDITLISVTQKITSIEKYDQIILLMEGEIIASGKHDELIHTCPEYAQIYNSQKSTSHYE
ncbi:MAG: ABC transporter ATP-binding protein [Candidatus Peregrinibacteria bacterium]|nr:ABC transporter ATP-binding protein [Candidatus Peregrinibacteria bacterium]